MSLAKQDVGLCQVYEAGLEKRQTLVYNMWLYSWMEAFLQNAGDLGDSLNSMGGNSSQARIYASELLVTQKENHKDSLKLFKHVLALATIADDSCPQLRRYLH